MPREDFLTVSLRKEVIKHIDEFLESQKTNANINSRAALINAAIQEYLKSHKSIFEHINMMDDNVKIVDFTNNRIATIYFKNPSGVFCDLCDADDCEHIDFALAQEDVQKDLEKHGWKQQKPSHGARMIRILNAIETSHTKPVTLKQILSAIERIETSARKPFHKSLETLSKTLETLIVNGFIRIEKPQDPPQYTITEKGRNALTHHRISNEDLSRLEPLLKNRSAHR